MTTGTIRDALLRGTRRPLVRGEGAARQRFGDGLEFAEVRGYAFGDDPRRIDWAASARTGTLQSRIYLDEHALAFAAILDDSRSMSVGRRRRLADAAAEALDEWYGAAANDDRFARIAGGELVAPSAAHGRHAGAIVRAVTASAAFDLDRDLRTASAALRRGSACLVISDFFDLDAVDDALLHRCAMRLDMTALVARDPWYDDLPLRGFVRLRDAERGTARSYFVGPPERRRYRAAAAAREAAVTARLERAGWRTSPLFEANGRASVRAAFGLA